MALKELQIRNIRPADKVTQCTDDRGLYLEVHPNGSKLWRYKYRYMGKQKRLALGRYPDVGLAEARKRRDDARRQLEAGTDPLAERKHEKLVAVFKAANTFGEIAKEYIDKQVAQGQADTTTQKANWLLEQLDPIAARPVADLKPIDVLAALKRIEAKGKHETARRCRSFAGRVFRYAVATGRGESDPSSILRGALVVPKVKHHAAILDPKKMGELLRSIDAYSGHAITRLTVTHAHVLATPGMDSHSAYVALSRHRDGVALHYGRDDFADQSKLVRTLSRERGKDMASDYKPEQQFAERRGITFRERIVEIARQLPERAKSIFAGFRPQAHKLEALPAEQPRLSDQRRAVERYARAAADIGQMREQGLPILPHQREALEKAGKAFDAIRPHAAADLASAMQRQPELAREAADGRSQGAIRAMQLEAEIRADPAQRADRFVSDWQQLGQARTAMQQGGDTKGAREVSSRMSEMTKGLERDAQVESLLRGRTRELGIKTELGRDLARDLAASVTMERSRSIGMGL